MNTNEKIITLGLSASEAKNREKKFGLNSVASERKTPGVLLFLTEFKNPLIIVLLVAAVLSFLTKSNIDGILIIFIVLASSVINFVSTYRSNKAVEMLLKKVRLVTTVYRDGVQKKIPAENLVVGDVVVLEAGCMLPADGVVLEAKDFFLNESSLTGESLPTEKHEKDEVFLGTGVVTGTANIEITKIGKDTKYFKIISLMEKKSEPSEFEVGIKNFSIFITKIVIGMAVLVFVINAFMKGSILEAVLFSAALAVGITPELLPIIISFNTSRASIRMSKKGVIVKTLEAVQNFGSMDVLCTDKTGTLTEDKIALVKYLDVNGVDSLDVLELAYLTSSFHTGKRGPLDEAIRARKDFDIELYKKIDEIPFDFERRRDSVVVEKAGKLILIAKGAPENVFTACSIDQEEKNKIQQLFEKLSADGYRVLGVSTKILTEKKDIYERDEEHDMVFAGFIAFIDPPKPDIKVVLEEIVRRGISVKVITGDHLLVAEKVAREVGFKNIISIDGSVLEKMSDDELSARLEETNIFARVVPEQKNRIISLLRKQGHVVGYMGDGINDAPALKTADIGISVSNAVDVAKESADIVLSHKSLSELIDGVLEGRRTFTNTIKYITMAVSSNFGNMFSMTGASLLFKFLPMLPAQVLLTNLLYETSQFSLPFDTVEDEILNKPQPWNISFIKRFMVVFGLASSIFDFITFYVLFHFFHLSDGSFQTGWFLQSFATQTLVVFIIRSPKSFWNSLPTHPAVKIAAWGAVVIAWGIALSFVGKLFGFVPLSLPIIVAISVVVLIYLIVIEIVKKRFYKRFVM